ncbi:MAG: hypothetical protein NDI69_05445 [Bacteriovoracaceae bacterium]|nr:hypothetical protein [Bacteriovoracaceae bacterium]
MSLIICFLVSFGAVANSYHSIALLNHVSEKHISHTHDDHSHNHHHEKTDKKDSNHNHHLDLSLVAQPVLIEKSFAEFLDSAPVSDDTLVSSFESLLSPSNFSFSIFRPPIA